MNTRVNFLNIEIKYYTMLNAYYAWLQDATAFYRECDNGIVIGCVLINNNHSNNGNDSILYCQWMQLEKEFCVREKFFNGFWKLNSSTMSISQTEKKTILNHFPFEMYMAIGKQQSAIIINVSDRYNRQSGLHQK